MLFLIIIFFSSISSQPQLTPVYDNFVSLNTATETQKCLSKENNKLVFSQCLSAQNLLFNFNAGFVGQVTDKATSQCLYIDDKNDIVFSSSSLCSPITIYNERIYYQNNEITFALAEHENGAAYFSPFESRSVLFPRIVSVQPPQVSRIEYTHDGKTTSRAYRAKIYFENNMDSLQGHQILVYHDELTAAVPLSPSNPVVLDTSAFDFMREFRIRFKNTASGQYSVAFVQHKVCYECKDNSGSCFLQKEQCTGCGLSEIISKITGRCEKCLENEIPSRKGDSCFQCPSGEYPVTSGSLCGTCKNGSIYNSVKKVCVFCEAKHYFDIAKQICTQCPGDTMPIGNGYRCGKCKEDEHYNPATNKCFQCSDKEMFDAGTNSCHACTDGKLAINDGKACGLCGNAQSYNAKTKNCVDCLFGHYFSKSNNVCETCFNLDFFSFEEGRCKKCPAGQKPKLNKDGCELCPKNTQLATTGHCTKCPPGKYLLSTTAKCVWCQKDQYLNSNGDCKLCDVGKVPVSSGTECAVCQTYDLVERNCVNCDAQSYANTANICSRCKDGEKPINFGRECGICAANDFYDKNRRNCVNCPPNSVFDSKDGTCNTCGDFTVPGADRKSCEPCGANQLFHLDTKICETCPRGEVPTPDKSKCQRCTTGRPVNNGASCGVCDDGHFMDLAADKCRPCSEATEDQMAGGLCPGKPRLCDKLQIMNLVTENCRMCAPNQKVDTVKQKCFTCPKGEMPIFGGLKCGICESQKPKKCYDEVKRDCRKCTKRLFVWWIWLIIALAALILLAVIVYVVCVFRTRNKRHRMKLEEEKLEFINDDVMESSLDVETADLYVIKE